MVATSLPRRVVGVALSLGKEHLLDFVVDAHEPCLGARGAIAKMRGLGLGFPHPFFGCPKLKRKFMSKVHGPFAVFVRHVRGLLQQGYDRSPGVIGRGAGILLPFGPQTAQWYLLCREHHTHSSHSLRPMMIGCVYHSLRRRAGENLALR